MGVLLGSLGTQARGCREAASRRAHLTTACQPVEEGRPAGRVRGQYRIIMGSRRAATAAPPESVPRHSCREASAPGRRHGRRPGQAHALGAAQGAASRSPAARWSRTRSTPRASLAPRALVLVVGHGGDAVRAALAAPDLAFVTQDPQRGTGDAVRLALAALPEDGVTLVANGDCPLIPAATYAALAEVAATGKLAVLTARASDPSGLGRVVRDADGSVRAIVEERDATPEERAIAEIYTGTLAAPTPLLRRFVAALKDDNAQREFYLTDVVALAVAAGVPVEAHVAADEAEVLGVNDRAQLAAIERIVQARLADALMEAGTSIADPARIDIRGIAPLRPRRADRRRLRVRGHGRARRRCRGRRRIACCAMCTIGPRHRDRAVLAPRRRHDRRRLPRRTVRAVPARRDARRGRPHRQLRRGEGEPRRARARRPTISPTSAMRRSGRARQRRRRHDRRELRRREQAPDRDRGRRFDRIELCAGRAGHGRQGRDDRRRQHDHEGCAGRTSSPLARARQVSVAGWKRPVEEGPDTRR